MIEAPKPFWYFAGSALLVIALAVGWRIVHGSGNFKIQDGDLSLSLDGVQQNISAAQQTVAQVQKESQAQREEIVQLEQTISADQVRISQLLAQIQNTPQAPVALKNSARALLAEQSNYKLPAVRSVNPALLKDAQTKLDNAQRFAAKLTMRPAR